MKARVIWLDLILIFFSHLRFSPLKKKLGSVLKRGLNIFIFIFILFFEYF